MKSVHGGSGGLAYIDHDGVLRETASAVLFQIDNEEVWLPKSQIQDQGDEIVAIPTWLASKNGLKSDW